MRGLRTVSKVRDELRALQNQYLSIRMQNALAAELVAGDYVERIAQKKQTINFLTTRVRRRKVYNCVRKHCRRLKNALS